MTPLDYQLPQTVYYDDSNFPCEYGGGRRQKHARTKGLDIQPGERIGATTRQFERGKWAIYTADADGRIFVLGTTVPVGPDSFGWIEEVDPVTLERIRVSPDLETGGHNFCAGSLLLRDGHFLACFGRYVHKLNLNLEPVGELELDVDHAHNGLLLLSDGMAITRNLEHDHQKKSVFTVVDPSSMTQVQQLEFVGASVGRFCVDPQEDHDHVYATTPTHIHRLIYQDGRLELDSEWSASYRVPGADQGFAWCNCVGDDSVWFMDMGDNEILRQVMTATPVGTEPLDLSGVIYPHSAPVRLHRVSTDDATSIDSLNLFDVPHAWQGASPLYAPEKRIVMGFDTANGKVGAWKYHGPGNFSHLWSHDITNSNQPLYYPDTGEVIVDDVRADQSVDSVVLDIETGEEKARINTATMGAAGMAPSPGLGRDYYGCSGVHGALYRIFVETDAV
jgi:hypothetical protein